MSIVVTALVAILGGVLMQNNSFKWLGVWNLTQASFMSTWALTMPIVAAFSALTVGRFKTAGLKMMLASSPQHPINIYARVFVWLTGVSLIGFVVSFTIVAVQTAQYATMGGMRSSFVVATIAYVAFVVATGMLAGRFLPRLAAPIVAAVVPYAVYGGVAFASGTNPLAVLTPMKFGLEPYVIMSPGQEILQSGVVFCIAVALVLLVGRMKWFACVAGLAAVAVAVPLLLVPKPWGAADPIALAPRCESVVHDASVCLTNVKSYALPEVKRALQRISVLLPGFVDNTDFRQYELKGTVTTGADGARKVVMIGLASNGYMDASQINVTEFYSAVSQQIIPTCTKPLAVSEKELPAADGNDVFGRWYYEQLGVDVTLKTGTDPAFQDGITADFKPAKAADAWWRSQSAAAQGQWVQAHKAKILRCELTIADFA